MRPPCRRTRTPQKARPAAAAGAAETGRGQALRPRPADLSCSRLSEAYCREPFRLSRRRPPCRGRGAARHRRGRRHAVLLLFDGDADAPLRGLFQGLRRPRRAGLLRHEGEFQPGGAAARWPGSAPAPTWSRKASCARALAAGIPAEQDRVLRRRQDRRARWTSRSRPASCASTSNPSRNSSCCRRAPWPMGKTAPVSLRINPDVDARTHTKISTGKAENKFGIPLAARARGLCPRRRAARHPGRRHRHAYRQPDHRPAALRRRLRAAGRAGRARCAPTATPSSHVDLGGGLGIPYQHDNDAAARCPTPMPRSCSKHVGKLGLQGDVRAGPADRRQCRHPRHRGDLS